MQSFEDGPQDPTLKHVVEPELLVDEPELLVEEPEELLVDELVLEGLDATHSVVPWVSESFVVHEPGFALHVHQYADLPGWNR